MTVAMGEELVAYGGPIDGFGEAAALAAALLGDGPEGLISELPITRRYVLNLTGRAWDMGHLSRRREQAMLDEIVTSFAEAIYFAINFVEHSQPVFKLSRI